MNVIHVPPAIIVNDGKISSVGSYSEIALPKGSVRYVVIGNQYHEVHHAQPNSGYHVSFNWDPMIDYLAWYGHQFIPFQNEVLLSDVQQKCWTQNEVNDYLVDNIKGQVFVQRINSSQWKLVFIDCDDASMFRLWWDAKQKQHFIEVPFDTEEDEDVGRFESRIYRWCQSNLVGKWVISLSTNSRVYVCIKDEKEAVMFKLVFGGIFRD